MGHVHILRGLPGAGKSTRAKELASSKNIKSVICSWDDYFYDKNGKFNYEDSKVAAAYGVCFKKFIESCQKGVSRIIVNNMNIYLHEIATYVEIAQAFNYSFEIENIHCDPKVAFDRKAHFVTEEQYQKMVEDYYGEMKKIRYFYGDFPSLNKTF